VNTLKEQLIQLLTSHKRSLNTRVILWTDKERQWEKAIPILQQELPELLVLGTYNPENKTGPAIWLRCVIAGKTESYNLPGDKVPILYLPGVSKQDLRALDSCPDDIKPLVEIQFRGSIWSQHNGKDWTILAFLVSDKGGLGLEVAQDNETKKAITNALLALLQENIYSLKGKKLDKDFFNSVLTGGDPIRDVLKWLDHNEEFENSLSEEELKAFNSICKSKFGYDPSKEGVLSGLSYIVSKPPKAVYKTQWQKVWERYCEAPNKYPNIPKQILRLQVPNDTIFWLENNGEFDRYPQWNEDMEKKLRNDLVAVSEMDANEVRSKITELEKQHRRRLELVWKELGLTKNAQILKYLADIVVNTSRALDAGTLEEIQEWYSDNGWKADLAFVKLLEQVKSSDDLNLIKDILKNIYIPWIENSARYLQREKTPVQEMPHFVDSEVILFVDGLRFDISKYLTMLLREKNYQIKENIRWASLPTITGTCKPMILMSILCDSLNIQKDSTQFEVISSHSFKKALETGNWILLNQNDSIPFPVRNEDIVDKRLWIELGNLDKLGHSQGWKLCKYIDNVLSEIMSLVKSLFDIGWRSVKILTDHGWLLFPGGLPKTDLSSHLAVSKWARFATIKEGVSTSENVFSWYWDENQQIAIADGISCYRQGEEFTHGGLSIQECLLLDIDIEKHTDTSKHDRITIPDIKWSGLRCSIEIEGDVRELLLDLRTSPADSLSSVALKVKDVKENGTASVVVEDESLEGEIVYIVLLNRNDGKVVKQISTIIGGGSNDST